MALVHCRVRRVFFGAVNPRVGALCSKWRLQDTSEFNHHYEVFQVVETDDVLMTPNNATNLTI
jgi:tRNA(Arg) A34 adenosine deaminase TadA